MKKKSQLSDKKEDTEEIKLYYYDCYARAESLRMLLTYGKVAFNDERLAMDK
jgi:hypothetical protein